MSPQHDSGCDSRGPDRSPRSLYSIHKQILPALGIPPGYELHLQQYGHRIPRGSIYTGVCERYGAERHALSVSRNHTGFQDTTCNSVDCNPQYGRKVRIYQQIFHDNYRT